MDTDKKVGDQYFTLRGSRGTAAERRGWVGKSYEEFNATAIAEVNGRETHKRNLESAVGVLTKERDAARAEAAKLAKELLGLRDQIKVFESEVVEKDAEVNGLKETLTLQEEAHEEKLKEINDVIRIKDNEIDRLTKELAECGTDYESLTGWELIALGIKKLIGK